MLGDVLSSEVSLGLSALSLAGRSGESHVSEADLNVSAKELLKSVSDLLNSNSWEDLSDQEARQLCGIIQQIRSQSHSQLKFEQTTWAVF